MPLAILNDKVFFFVHVPKCGGTSIKSFLEENGCIAFDGHGYNEWSKCTVDHIHTELYDKMVPKEFYDFGFIVFRDPIERMVSEFRMHAKPASFSVNPINWILYLFAKIRGKTVYKYKFLSIYWFVDIDCWAWGALCIAKLFPYRANNHFRPQSEFWRQDLEVFFFEDGLTNVFNWIINKSDLKRQNDGLLPHENRGKQKNELLSEFTRFLIKKYYRSDYELFEKLKLRTASDKNK